MDKPTQPKSLVPQNRWVYRAMLEYKDGYPKPIACPTAGFFGRFGEVIPRHNDVGNHFPQWHFPVTSLLTPDCTCRPHGLSATGDINNFTSYMYLRTLLLGVKRQGGRIFKIEEKNLNICGLQIWVDSPQHWIIAPAVATSVNDAVNALWNTRKFWL